MFDQDILFNRLREGSDELGPWVGFLITKKGRDFAARVFGEGKIEMLTDHGVEAIFVNPKMGVAFYRDCQNADLTVHYCGSYMTYMSALLNARQQTDDQRRELTETAVSDYYGPLLDKAIAEHHASDDEKARSALRKQIAALIREIPQTIVKAFVMDRLRYGSDAFAEIKVPGATLDNWHLPPQKESA